jgi:2-polyprenyl-6-methoxyphenol hydroxylase-like FAD-dependent oxidoreductase
MTVQVAIIGGGVAGAATALCLSQIGIECAVFERAIGDATEGMGLILMANGLGILQRLGLADRARASGARADRMIVRSSTGRTLVDKPIPEHVGLRRRDLVDLVRAALPPGILKQGFTFARFDQNGRGRPVRARFEDGSTVEAELFVGADGVHSLVRHRLYPEHRGPTPWFNELVCIVSAPDVAAELGNRLVKTRDERGGLAVGIVPAGAGRVIWYIQYDFRRFRLGADTLQHRKELASTLVRHWPAPIPLLLERTEARAFHLWNTTDMDLLPRFHGENVVLVGDAAHPLLSVSTQGASSALEDALALAECLAAAERAGGGLPQAFAAFDAKRRPAIRAYLEDGRRRATALL